MSFDRIVKKIDRTTSAPHYMYNDNNDKMTIETVLLPWRYIISYNVREQYHVCNKCTIFSC